MSLPTMIADHNHVSERESAHTWPDGQRDDSHWEDCLWCSVVELLNDTYSAALPDSLTYAEKLRDASGEPPTGGSNAWQAQAAIKKVTGLYIPIVTGFDALWGKLQPGTGAAIAGSMGAFTYGHRLRRHLPSFNGGHSVYVARVDDLSHVWWCDPLAADSGYKGEWVSKAELKSFVDALPGGGNLYRELRNAHPISEDTMTPYAPVTTTTAQTITVPSGRVIYDLDGTTRIGSLPAALSTVSPFGAGTVEYGGQTYYRRVVAYKLGTTPRRLYIVRALASELKPITDATQYDVADLLDAKRDVYDAIVKAIPPRP